MNHPQKYVDCGAPPAIFNVIREVIHTWFEQALVESVIGIKALEGSREWTHEDIKEALPEEALTTAVQQRSCLCSSKKRARGEIGRKDVPSKLGGVTKLT